MDKTYTADILANMTDRHKLTGGHFFTSAYPPLPPVYVPFPTAIPVTPGWGRVEWAVKKRRVFQLSPGALGVKVGE